MGSSNSTVESLAAIFSVERVPDGEGGERLHMGGELRFQSRPEDWRSVLDLVGPSRAQRGQGRLDLDLAGVEGIDGASAALVIQLRSDLCAAGRSGVIHGARGQVARVLELYGSHPLQPSEKEAPCRQGAFDQLGAATVRKWGETRTALALAGELAVELGRTVLSPRRVSWSECVVQFGRVGPDSLPIVVLIHFLVGLILALQSAVQLDQFGAAIYAADLVGLSLVRELAPLMTGILLAGRSGASFAAELGTMRVSEEVDALETLGISPVRYLVLPRFLSLVIAAPMLTLAANAVGILGGLAIGVLALGLSPVAYWSRTVLAIDMTDIVSGLVKSVVFAGLVALIGCERGLATRGGAAGVGRATTSAVVTTIFYLVVADALFTYMFNLYGV